MSVSSEDQENGVNQSNEQEGGCSDPANFEGKYADLDPSSFINDANQRNRYRCLEKDSRVFR
jgi:hypothetical protein